MQPQYISAKDLQKVLNQGEANFLLLDVRTPLEFAEVHIKGALNVELSEFTGSEDFLVKNDKIFVICKGGVRAGRACQKIPQSLISKAFILEGGMDAWISENFQTVKIKNIKIPVIQQMQIVVGILIVVFSLLALTVCKLFAVVPLLIGCGLTFAGFTGICMMMKFLAKMPWNKI